MSSSSAVAMRSAPSGPSPGLCERPSRSQQLRTASDDDGEDDDENDGEEDDDENGASAAAVRSAWKTPTTSSGRRPPLRRLKYRPHSATCPTPAKHRPRSIAREACDEWSIRRASQGMYFMGVHRGGVGGVASGSLPKHANSRTMIAVRVTQKALV